MTELQQFTELVDQMRTAQRGYFKAQWQSSEKQEFLKQSKMLEKKVDDEIKRFQNLTQKELF